VNIGESFNSPFGQAGGKSLGDLVSLILRGAFAIAGIIILFFLIAGGIQIMAGAGKDNPEAAAKGKQAITAAAIGFAVVFVAYWVIRIIELIAGRPFITAPGI
jgi:hypothetical protein